MTNPIPSPFFNPFDEKLDQIRKILKLSPSDPLVIAFGNGNKSKLPEIHPTIRTPDILVRDMDMHVNNLTAFEIALLSTALLNKSKEIAEVMFNKLKGNKK